MASRARGRGRMSSRSHGSLGELEAQRAKVVSRRMLRALDVIRSRPDTSEYRPHNTGGDDMFDAPAALASFVEVMYPHAASVASAATTADMDPATFIHQLHHGAGAGGEVDAPPAQDEVPSAGAGAGAGAGDGGDGGSADHGLDPDTLAFLKLAHTFVGGEDAASLALDTAHEAVNEVVGCRSEGEGAKPHDMLTPQVVSHLVQNVVVLASLPGTGLRCVSCIVALGAGHGMVITCGVVWCGAVVCVLTGNAVCEKRVNNLLTTMSAYNDAWHEDVEHAQQCLRALKGLATPSDDKSAAATARGPAGGAEE